MKSKAVISFAVIFTLLSATSAFAAPGTLAGQSAGYDIAGRHNCEECLKDPIAALEEKKSEISDLLKEGKITQQKADEMINRIDAKIAEIKAFSKLTLQQKKDKLIKDCKNRLDVLVKAGKFDRKKADEILKNYTEKIKQWDGTGYPKFFDKGMRGKKR